MMKKSFIYTLMAKKEKEKVNSTFTPGKSTRPESVH